MPSSTMQLLLALLALAYVAPSTEDSHWCYEIQAKEPNSHCSGPEQWTGDCKKNQQSPINIVTSKTKLNPSLTPFTFVGYDQKKKWEVKNNQHSVEMSLGEDIYIFGGDLPTQYKAIQLHLHWSEESNKGSEHSIDGKHFAMEMHVVHKKMTTGDKVQDSDSKDKIAVLAFMVEVGLLSSRWILEVTCPPGSCLATTAPKEPISCFFLSCSRWETR
ncbi:carbonic anhydrase 4 isoform X2 [Rattus norvegicus]|uniref:carbonic anhydrase 4 isoform X2 n=1 Tax=Rattus norvegicus TaxID=10116 RepID=UPI002FD8754F